MVNTEQALLHVGHCNCFTYACHHYPPIREADEVDVPCGLAKR